MKFAVSLTVRAAQSTTLLQLAIVLRQHRLDPICLLRRPAEDPDALYWFLLEAGQAQIGALCHQLKLLGETVDVRAEEWTSEAPLPREPAADFWAS